MSYDDRGAMKTDTHAASRSVEAIFDRIVCGVDASEAGAEAAQYAARIAASDGTLTLLTVSDTSIAVHAGFRMSYVLDKLAEESRLASGRGREVAEAIRSAETRSVRGDPRQCLLAEIAREDATLVVVGSHGQSRAEGIALGSVATHMLHEAPCSVLIARPTKERERWPSSIVVGTDGSPAATGAMAVANALAERFGAHVRVLVATGGKPLDLEELHSAENLEFEERKPADCLVAASKDADLIVLGSRGLHGFAALGSVSERVAHKASCPVLVVR